MIDPINTTAHDGAPCHLCGEEAVMAIPIAEGAQMVERPLCGPCQDDHVTKCSRCETTIWQRDGTRVFTTPELFCGGCYVEMLAAIQAVAFDFHT